MSIRSDQNQNPVLRRELGDQERLLHNVHRFAGLIGVQVMQIKGPLVADTVRAALNRLQKLHPILQAHIKITGVGMSKEMPWFFLRRDFIIPQTLPIPLQIIENANPGDWEIEMQRQLNTPIRGKHMPRVRAVLLHLMDQPDNNILMLATDHAVADAQAANMMTCQVLEFLGNPQIVVPHDTAQNLPASLEEATPQKSKK